MKWRKPPACDVGKRMLAHEERGSMGAFFSNLRIAARGLRNRPGMAAVAIVTLGLGIGANTAIFSVIDKNLIHPLPYTDSDRMLGLYTTFLPSGVPKDGFSPANYLDVAQQIKSLEAVAAISSRSVTLTGDGEPETILGYNVTSPFFRVLGVRPELGRILTPQDEESAGTRVVVLGHGIWKQRFGGRRDIIGKEILIAGASWQVVGVMPDGLGFPNDSGLWLPLHFPPALRVQRGNIYLSAAARLKPGATIEQARSELNSLGARLAKDYPGANAGLGLDAEPFADTVLGPARRRMEVLFAAVIFVTAVCCVNLVSVLLARANERSREIAIRTALGASRFTLVRQFLTESFVLVVLGSALAILLAVWAIPAILSVAPAELPRLRAVSLDGRVLWFTLIVSCAAVLITGLLPGLLASKENPERGLREGSRGAGTGARRRNLQDALVVAEVAVVLVLLVGSGLLIRSFQRLQSVNPGFRSEGLISWQLFLPSSRYSAAEAPVTLSRILEVARDLGDVRSAALVNPPPFAYTPMVNDADFYIEGRPESPPEQIPLTLRTRVSDGYFETMGIRLSAGRVIGPQDHEKASRVAVINETLQRRFFAGENPVGKRIRFGQSSPTHYEIVGVTADVHHNDLSQPVRPETYTPLAQDPIRGATLVARARNHAVALMPSLKQRIWEIDSQLPATFLAPMDRYLSQSLAPYRFLLILTTRFALLSLLLAAVGIYGVLTQTINSRRREMGVRLALGATQPQIRRRVTSQGAKLTVFGSMFGLIGALAGSQFLSTILYEVNAADPATYIAAVSLILVTTLIACFIPAVRASRTDPAIILREE